jgi:hypothetical protein
VSYILCARRDTSSAVWCVATCISCVYVDLVTWTLSGFPKWRQNSDAEVVE